MNSHRKLSGVLFILGLSCIITGLVIASDAVGEEWIYPPTVKTITTYPYIREATILIVIGALILLIAYVILFRSLGARQ